MKFLLSLASVLAVTTGCVALDNDEPELTSEEAELDANTCLANTGATARQTSINNYIANNGITSCLGFQSFGGFATTRSCSGGGRFAYGARIVYNPSKGCAYGVPKGALGSAENAIHARWNASGGNGSDLLGGPIGELMTVTVPAGAPKRYYQYLDSSALAVGAGSAPTTAYAVGGYHAAAGAPMRVRWHALGSNRQFPIENTSCDASGRCILALEADGAGAGAHITRHTSSTDAFLVSGSFFTAWNNVARTVWGWPITDRVSDGTLRSYQRFHNGGALASSTGGTTVQRLDGALGTKWFAGRATTG